MATERLFLAARTVQYFHLVLAYQRAKAVDPAVAMTLDGPRCGRFFCR